MAMQINGNDDYFRTDYGERVRERQALERTEKAKEEEAESAGQRSEPRDEYISGKKTGKESAGLYRVGQDENGRRKFFYDNPKAEENSRGEPAKCVGNTDAVDREIRKLKEKKQELEQQLQSAAGDEKKIRELEKKLTLVEQELSQKDNDTYRRQHTVFSQT